MHLEIDYPDVKADLNRWLPLVKWFLAIPHYLVLAVLALGAVIVWVIAWFAILFTGRYPRALFDYLVGVGRWGLRVQAYAFPAGHRPIPAVQPPPKPASRRRRGRMLGGRSHGAGFAYGTPCEPVWPGGWGRSSLAAGLPGRRVDRKAGRYGVRGGDDR